MTSPLLDAFLRDYVLPRAAEIPPEVRAFCTSLPPGTRLAGNPRVSTEAQVSGGSLPEQREAFSRFAAAHGLTVVWIQEDAGVSGRDVTLRHGLLRLLAGVHEGLFDAVAVYDLTRLSRRTSEGAAVLDFLEDRGAKLVTRDTVYDLSQEGDRAQVGLLLVFAEQEYRRSRSRAEFGRRRKRDAGGWPGGPAPFGYRLVRPGDPPVVVPEEAALVRRALLDLYPHYTDRETARLLNGGGFTARGRHWTSMRVYRLHEVYHDRRQPRPHDRLLTYAGLLLDSSGGVTEAAWEPVISREELTFLEEVRGGRNHARTVAPRSFLLSSNRLAFCGGCGATVNGSSSRARRLDGSVRTTLTYRCNKTRGPCLNWRAWNVEDADGAVLDGLASKARELGETYDLVVKREALRAGELRRELVELRKKKRRVAEAVAEGFPLDELRVEAVALAERERRVGALLEAGLTGEEITKRDLGVVQRVLSSPALLRADANLARETVRLFVRRLTFGPGDPLTVLWADGSETVHPLPRRRGDRCGSTPS